VQVAFMLNLANQLPKEVFLPEETIHLFEQEGNELVRDL
jgi:hypothetical protein